MTLRSRLPRLKSLGKKGLLPWFCLTLLASSCQRDEHEFYLICLKLILDEGQSPNVEPVTKSSHNTHRQKNVLDNKQQVMSLDYSEWLVSILILSLPKFKPLSWYFNNLSSFSLPKRP